MLIIMDQVCFFFISCSLYFIIQFVKTIFFIVNSISHILYRCTSEEKIFKKYVITSLNNFNKHKTVFTSAITIKLKFMVYTTF